mgnify:CR=1 FL=1
MADSPLMIKSKAFALNVIQVCKELRLAKCESALINQFCVRERVLEQILEKLFMLTEKPTLLPNCKLL